MIRGAAAAEMAGLSCLRMNLRGSDRMGEDYYHGGLTVDLHAALASSEAQRYRRIYLLGYSLGGHVVLRLATEPADPRLVAVAAVCAPWTWPSPAGRSIRPASGSTAATCCAA